MPIFVLPFNFHSGIYMTEQMADLDQEEKTVKCIQCSGSVQPSNVVSFCLHCQNSSICCREVVSEALTVSTSVNKCSEPQDVLVSFTHQAGSLTKEVSKLCVPN